MDGEDTAAHCFSLPAPTWPWERRCDGSTAHKSGGGKALWHLFVRKQTGWSEVAPQAPCYFLRRTKAVCSQQHKVQWSALAVPRGMLGLSTSSFPAADEAAHLLCLGLTSPLLTKRGSWWLNRKRPKAGEAL